jgi:hypothetical protein
MLMQRISNKGASMGGDPQWIPQDVPGVPDGYEIGAEWGELTNGEVGVGCYVWTDEDWTISSDPFPTPEAALRDLKLHLGLIEPEDPNQMKLL